jgi:hypothetical protein
MCRYMVKWEIVISFRRIIRLIGSLVRYVMIGVFFDCGIVCMIVWKGWLSWRNIRNGKVNSIIVIVIGIDIDRWIL